jgi:ATP-dependent RNA helicase DHX29
MSLVLDLLMEVRAIDSGGQLMLLGHHLSKLPMDVHLGKMLILATMFCCLDPALIVMASLLSISPIPSYARDCLEAQTHQNSAQASSLILPHLNS